MKHVEITIAITGRSAPGRHLTPEEIMAEVSDILPPGPAWTRSTCSSVSGIGNTRKLWATFWRREEAPEVESIPVKIARIKALAVQVEMSTGLKPETVRALTAIREMDV